jgi:hypothetical protein
MVLFSAQDAAYNAIGIVTGSLTSVMAAFDRGGA